MSNATNNIVPANNFEARKLDGFRQSVPGAEVESSGWGVWDIEAGAWVSLNDTCRVMGKTIPVPFSVRNRRTAQRAFADGLIDGYGLVA